MHPPYRPAGIHAAQWIPTDAAGRINREALEALLAFEKLSGIDGVLALGSTGEFPHFSPAERRQAIGLIAELAAPLPVIVNVTDIRPRVSVDLGRFAQSLGLAAMAVMPPMFYPVSQADMLAYFLHLADAVELPVILYNFPELTGKRIELATIAALADRAPLAAIKQSGGDFEYHRELITLGREKGFVVMSGADTRLPEAFKLGAAGCIGGLANIVPELMVGLDRICRQGVSGDPEPAAEAMREVGRIIDQLTFPSNIAAGVEARGLRAGVPKAIQSDESRALHATIVRELGALFTRLKLPPARIG